MVVQVYALTSNAEEAEVEWFYEDLKDLLELTPKKRSPFHSMAFSLVAASGGYGDAGTSHCGGLSCCTSMALELRLNSCGTWT